MKRTDGLGILQDTLKGQSLALRKLHKEKLRESMPFIEVYGAIDALNCPEALLDVNVYGDQADGASVTLSVREFIQRMKDKAGTVEWHSSRSAVALLKPDGNQFDLVPLHAIQLTNRDYKRCDLAGGTVGDLREYSRQSAYFVDDPSYIYIFFDAEPMEIMTATQTHLLS